MSKTIKPVAVVLAACLMGGLLAADCDNNPAPTAANPHAAAPMAVAEETAPLNTNIAADETFLRDAAQANLAEVKAGKLAASRASSDEVKKFGAQMAEDHGGNLQKVKDLAAQKGFTLPADVKEKDAKLASQLEKLSGPDFDRTYMQAMVDGHREVIANFEREANTGKDADVKAYASKTLPTLRHHLEMAEDANRQVSVSNRETSSEKNNTPSTEVSHPAPQPSK